MPYSIRKIRYKSKPTCYRVYNTKSKRVFARCTTKKNAEKQMRLLRAIQYNKKFVPYANKS